MMPPQIGFQSNYRYCERQTLASTNDICYKAVLIQFMIFLVLATFLLAVLGQQHPYRQAGKPPAQIMNYLRPGEPILLKLCVKHAQQILFQSEYDLLYTLEQPQIIQNVTLSTAALSQNLTLHASLFKVEPYLEEISYEQQNLTRFQKIRKNQDQDSIRHGGSYDLIDEVMPADKEEEQITEYGLHIAKDFNVLVLFTDVTFARVEQIQPQMNLRTYKQFSPPRFTTGLEVSQFQIPYRSYAVAGEGEHNVTFHIQPYDFFYSLIFYSLGHPQIMTKQAGVLGQLVGLGLDEYAIDEMKQILFTNHIYLLVAYFGLSFIQTILKFFTIRQEYRFWKDIQKNRGMSLKTLFFELGAQVIVTLYLIEHDSTKLVIFFCILDIVIVIWKITRTFKVGLNSRFPFLTFTTSEHYKKREKLDSQAIWYMNYLLAPLSVVYFGWSLYSKGGQIKSVYTFLLQNAVAFIAIFGFIMMTPQLYINYQLKSVEHMNWRGLIYRFINTILDDIFAFMVTIPTLRRLMYFRDDIIFVIYIYQRWIYKVDYSRKTISTMGEPSPEELKME